MLKVRIVREDKEIPLPTYATSGASGMDLMAIEDIVIPPKKWCAVRTGLRIELPPGYEAQIRPRSGLALKHGITVLNTPGTIDPDYRGEIKVILINHGDEPYLVRKGDRIAQMVITKIEKVNLWEEINIETLTETERGEGGFGHTGR